jgi:hypothetical protein
MICTKGGVPSPPRTDSGHRIPRVQRHWVPTYLHEGQTDVEAFKQASGGFVQDNPHDHDSEDAKDRDDAKCAGWFDVFAADVARRLELERPDYALVALHASVSRDTRVILPAFALTRRA